MYDIIKIEKPEIVDFANAFKVCLERWPHLESLNRPKRFEAFQSFGVELVLALKGNSVEGVCFVLPDTVSASGKNLSFVWLFDFAVSERAKGLGAPMMLKMMSWYPLAMAIGAARDTEKIYHLMGWKKMASVWRCVHPIRLQSMLELYADRLTPFAQQGLKSFSKLYEWFMPRVENVLSNGYAFHEGIRNDSGSARLKAVSSYLNTFHLEDHSKLLQVVERASVGRIVHDPFCGWKRLRIHAKLWKESRNRGMDYTEFLSTSPRQKKRAMWIGYVPLSMPLYIWDSTGQLSEDCSELDLSHFNFASSDKIL